jgi:hypothetical protein
MLVLFIYSLIYWLLSVFWTSVGLRLGDWYFSLGSLVDIWGLFGEERRREGEEEEEEERMKIGISWTKGMLVIVGEGTEWWV